MNELMHVSDFPTLIERFFGRDGDFFSQPGMMTTPAYFANP